MNFPGGWELVLVVVVIMVLFGAKRLPDASRSIGRSLRILKSETRGLHDADDDTPRGADNGAGAVDGPTPVVPRSSAAVVD